MVLELIGHPAGMLVKKKQPGAHAILYRTPGNAPGKEYHKGPSRIFFL
jgi:hypothetical protein